jgi:xanthine dehydrogenase YagS FAD-binding subunit
MKNFTYYRPSSVDAAVGLLGDQWGKTELLAGGTDLLDLLKEYVAQPDKVVSLAGIAGTFDKITRDDESKSYGIGAMVKLSAIAENEILRRTLPGLTTAAGMIGGPQIRNMGTLGGNLCQRNRCWYFRDEHVPCLLKGGTKCFALDGENQYHAIFTKGHPCVIVHPSTLAPVLVALNAKAEIQGPKGKRTVPLSEFFKAPTSPDHREHVLAANEVLLGVSIPMSDSANASYEVRHKQSYDWPLVQAAAAFTLKGGRATNVRIVLGHVAPTPQVATFAATALEGKEVNEATAAEAGRAALIERTETVDGKASNVLAKPLSQNGYKLKLVEVAVKRALLTAAGANRYWEV